VPPSSFSSLPAGLRARATLPDRRGPGVAEARAIGGEGSRIRRRRRRVAAASRRNLERLRRSAPLGAHPCRREGQSPLALPPRARAASAGNPMGCKEAAQQLGNAVACRAARSALVGGPVGAPAGLGPRPPVRHVHHSSGSDRVSGFNSRRDPFRRCHGNGTSAPIGAGSARAAFASGTRATSERTVRSGSYRSKLTGNQSNNGRIP
jgi:hypothetical protein